MLTQQASWTQVGQVLQKVETCKKKGQNALTCFYKKSGELVGSYFCGDDENEDFVLFVNKDYSDSALIVNLIDQHCKILNGEVKVYALTQKGIDLYKTVSPKNLIVVDL